MTEYFGKTYKRASLKTEVFIGSQEALLAISYAFYYNRIMKRPVLTKIKANLLRILPKNTGGIPVTLLLAVSGGADSMAMLSAISQLNKNSIYNLYVITVNHNIRPEKESAGDARFVFNFCKTLNPKTECIIARLEENEVKNTAQIRKGGTEDAARFLRYREFEKAAEKVNADYILTAHNQNDYYETVLMRLFQGSDSQSVTGIREIRGKFIRPMLNISRSEIEEYLKSEKIPWREDASNFEKTFLRNKIRHIFIPALNAHFSGWQTGLDSTLKKINEANRFIQSLYSQKKAAAQLRWELKKEADGFIAEFEDCAGFQNWESIFKIKFIAEGLLPIKDAGRISYSVIKDLSAISETKKNIYSGGFYIEKNGRKIRLSRKTSFRKPGTSVSYMIWIEKPCTFFLPVLPKIEFTAFVEGNGFFVKCASDTGKGIGPFAVPFCIRSREAGDVIKMKDGAEKHIKKILNEWGVSYEKRDIVPIIEERGIVKGIYGAVIGERNRYVP